MGAAGSVIAPITVGIGYGLTYIKDRHMKVQNLSVNVKKITTVVETRKSARIFAGIFTFGLTELMNHKNISEEYFYEDDFIGSNETEGAEALNKKGNECYARGNYETAAIFFARASDLIKNNGKVQRRLQEKYEENFNITRKKIREEAEKQRREEAARREHEEAMRREREEAVRREHEEAMRREREEAAKRKQENERKAREEALRLERARTQSKSLLEEATNIYQQAEAMSSLELKLENYEVALYKCEESCAFGATKETFKTLNKIFESCLKHDAHDEAESAVQIVRKYFPSEAGHLQDILVSQQNESWSPDYESIARRQQEQQEKNRTIMVLA